jgi:multidrug efflux pump
MRRSLGTAVLWGAFGVTLFGIFLTPVFYSVVRWLSDRRHPKPESSPAKEDVPLEGPSAPGR